MFSNEVELEAKSIIDDPEKTTTLVFVANKKANKERKTLNQIWHQLTLLLGLISDWIKGNYRHISTRSIVGFIIFLLYFVNPFDAVLDYLPGIGLLDDIAMAKFIFDSFKVDIMNYETWKNNQNQPEVTIEI